MRKVRVDRLKPGMVLGRTLYNERGDVLLAREVSLTPSYINALRAHGFYAVYIMDGIGDDVEPPDILSDHVRIATSKHVQELFDVVRTATADHAGHEQPDGSQPLSTVARPQVAQLYRDVESIIEDLANVKILTGVGWLKTHDNYTFEHTIEVTVAGVMLGKRLRMPSHELHQLALGCLYHDLGKLMVPPEILNKPGPLSPDELEILQRHPQTGFELVRPITGDSDIIARSIVRQHHERQDGTGYPACLRGSNHYDPDSRSRYHMGLIVPAAEIAAVADVYSSLVSDRPYRPALSAAEVVAALRQMAGSHLNREIVSRFLSILPTYPVGTEVVVISKKLHRYRGIVTEVDPDDIHRPTVRILFDPLGQRVTPFEVNTSLEREIELATPSYTEMAAHEVY